LNDLKHNYSAECRGILIRPLSERNIEQIRSWRNNKEISKYLTPIETISREQQKKWFSRYLEDENVMFFEIYNCEIESIIGTVALYNFDSSQCEIGKIIVGDERERGKGVGYQVFLMAMYIGMSKLGIKKFILSVCEENKAALKTYLKIGFKEIGRQPFQTGGTEIKMMFLSDGLFKNNETKEIRLL